MLCEWLQLRLYGRIHIGANKELLQHFYYTVRLPPTALPGKKWGIYREAARGVQNTSSDFTNDSISFWWSGIPTTVML